MKIITDEGSFGKEGNIIAKNNEAMKGSLYMDTWTVWSE